MKPVYIKKDGNVNKVAGISIPVTYPAEDITYDNTTSGLSADDAQGAIDEIVDTKVDKTDEILGKLNLPNTVIATDNSAFLSRECLNPEGFTGYEREKLIGASFAWNQLADYPAASTTINGVTITNNNDGSYTLSGKLTAGTAGYYAVCSISIQAGHKYLLIGCPSGGSSSTYFLGIGGLAADTGEGGIWKYDTDINSAVRFDFRNESDFGSGTRFVPQVFDLTLAFGSDIADEAYSKEQTTAGSGIAWLRSQGFFTKSYYPYNNGSLQSVKTSGKKVKKNLVETLSQGVYSSADGSYAGFSNDYTFTICKVNPNTTYTVSVENPGGLNLILYYNGDPSSDTASKWISNESITSYPYTFTTPSNCYYIVYETGGSAGPVTPATIGNVQIEKGSRVTSFESYSGITYPLGNDELRGIPKLSDDKIVYDGDIKYSNGVINRKYAIVDLGTLDWYYTSDLNHFRSDSITSLTKHSAYTMCSIYQAVHLVTAGSENNISNKSVGISTGYYSGVKYIIIRDDSYSDAAAFKTAMSGVYLVYELATPTTEQSTPFADPMDLSNAVTEEYIDTRTIPCPVFAERQYMGESDDVVEFPSSPMSDGKRVLTSYKSGNEEKLVWEGDILFEVVTHYWRADTTIVPGNWFVETISECPQGYIPISAVAIGGDSCPDITACSINVGIYKNSGPGTFSLAVSNNLILDTSSTDYSSKIIKKDTRFKILCVRM